jgi:hypothetical protein
VSSSDTYRGSPDVYQELNSAASIARNISQVFENSDKDLPSHEDTVIVGKTKAHCRNLVRAILSVVLVSGWLQSKIRFEPIMGNIA